MMKKIFKQEEKAQDNVGILTFSQGSSPWHILVCCSYFSACHSHHLFISLLTSFPENTRSIKSTVSLTTPLHRFHICQLPTSSVSLSCVVKGCSGDASYGCAIKVGFLQCKGACQSWAFLTVQQIWLEDYKKVVRQSQEVVRCST